MDSGAFLSYEIFYVPSHYRSFEASTLVEPQASLRKEKVFFIYTILLTIFEFSLV